MAALSNARVDSGTFAGATTGATIGGKGVSLRLDGTFTATVVLEYQDMVFDDWIIQQSFSAAPTGLVIVNDPVPRNWRVRCSAYTSGSPKYSVTGGTVALPVYSAGGIS